MAPGPRAAKCFHAMTTPSTQTESLIASCWQSPLVFERAAHTERSGKPLGFWAAARLGSSNAKAMSPTINREVFILAS